MDWKFTENELYLLQDIYDNALGTADILETEDDFIDITASLVYSTFRLNQLRDKYKRDVSKADAERVRRELAALYKAIDNLSPEAISHISPYDKPLRQFAAVTRKEKYSRGNVDYIRHRIALHASTIFRHFLIPKSNSRHSDLHEYLDLIVRLSEVNLDVHSLTMLTMKTRGHVIQMKD
ncbi:hypothetical protein [Thiolapillus sp.]